MIPARAARVQIRQFEGLIATGIWPNFNFSFLYEMGNLKLAGPGSVARAGGIAFINHRV
jgi:hypothetical protein